MDEGGVGGEGEEGSWCHGVGVQVGRQRGQKIWSEELKVLYLVISGISGYIWLYIFISGRKNLRFYIFTNHLW